MICGNLAKKEANDKAEKAYARLKKIGTHASGMRLIEPPDEQNKISSEIMQGGAAICG